MDKICFLCWEKKTGWSRIRQRRPQATVARGTTLSIAGRGYCQRIQPVFRFHVALHCLPHGPLSPRIKCGIPDLGASTRAWAPVRLKGLGGRTTCAAPRRRPPGHPRCGFSTELLLHGNKISKMCCTTPRKVCGKAAAAGDLRRDCTVGNSM